jgi:formylglycine-generating enzyme required for sulfatase activity
MNRSVLITSLFACSLIIGCAFSPLPTPHSPFSSDDMVYIPAGWFWMGSSQSDGKIGFEIGADELPKHKVYLKGFRIDRYEVTEKDYYRYLVATGKNKYPGYWKEAGREDRYPDGYENYPVSDVDWFDARDYCKWAGKRLPTEAEWEKAARGTDGRRWPWGNEFLSGLANTDENSREWKKPEGQKRDYGWKSPVGTPRGDVSPYGVYGMAGNVREWTASSYGNYDGNTVKTIKDGDRFKILRGGSFLTRREFSRTAARVAVLPTRGPRETDGWHSDYTYGIRCAR